VSLAGRVSEAVSAASFGGIGGFGATEPAST
jgi:hypothetical protein